MDDRQDSDDEEQGEAAQAPDSGPTLDEMVAKSVEERRKRLQDINNQMVVNFNNALGNIVDQLPPEQRKQMEKDLGSRLTQMKEVLDSDVDAQLDNLKEEIRSAEEKRLGLEKSIS